LKAKSDIIEAINSVNNNVPIDICEINIKNALEDIGEITGKNVSDDIINEIFKRFCVGK
jgi:tRNA modification GTPase